jgi:hypothetical protein
MKNEYESYGPPPYTHSTTLDAALWPSFRAYRTRNESDTRTSGAKTARLMRATCDESRAHDVAPYMDEIQTLQTKLNNGPKDNISRAWSNGINEVTSRASKESDLSIMMCYTEASFKDIVRTHPNLILDVRPPPETAMDGDQDCVTEMFEEGDQSEQTHKLHWADDHETFDDKPEAWKEQVTSFKGESG